MNVSLPHSQNGAKTRRSGHALLSVVVPVYNESLVIDTFHRRTSRALSEIADCEYELVFIDDGSSDDSYQQLSTLAAADSRVRVLKFSRNFGHQIAISAGVDHAQGDCVVVIDADLQDPPEVIGEMVDKWREGFDVVYGVRASRVGESRVKLLTASVFYRLLNKLTGISIPVDVGDFRLVSRRVAEQLRLLREKDRFVRGLVSWIGFQQTGVTYHREARFAGETKYPFAKMFKFAIDGVTSFSTVPLRLASWLGYATSALAFVYLVDVLWQKAAGITVQGWATTMVTLLFLGGVQLVCIGIMGEYVGRVFNECKPRPMYVLEESLGGSREVPRYTPALTPASRALTVPA